MKQKMIKIKDALGHLIVITLPMMLYIRPSGDSLINIALSDIFVALMLILFVGEAVNDFVSGKIKGIHKIKEKIKSLLPYRSYFGGLLVWIIVSAFHAQLNSDIKTAGIFVSLLELIKFIISMCYFYIAYNSCSDEKRTFGLLRTWSTTSLIVSCIGIAGTVAGYNGLRVDSGIFMIIREGRLVSTLTDPNLAAAYFSISFYVTLACIDDSKKRTNMFIKIITLITLVFAMILTQSRSAGIAFAISLLFYFTANRKHYYKYAVVIVLTVSILFFSFLNIDITYFDGYIQKNIESRMEEIKEFTGEAKIRSQLRLCAYEMGKDNFVIGVGRGNYRENSMQYFKSMGVDTNKKNYNEKYALKIPHNTYITFFAELGIVGLGVFVSIFILLFFGILKSESKFKLKCTILAVFASFLIQAFAINLENFRAMWVFLGISFVIMNIKDRDVQIEDSKHDSSSRIINRREVVWGLFVILCVVYSSTVGKISKPIEIDEMMQEIVDRDCAETEYIFTYNISEEEGKEGITGIRIYAISNEGDREILNELKYMSPNGSGRLEFNTNMDTESILIEIKNTHGKKIVLRDAKLICKNEGTAEVIFADYKYLPQILESNEWIRTSINNRLEVDVDKQRMHKNIILNHTNHEEINSLDEESVYFGGRKPVNLSDKVLFLGSDIRQIDGNKAKIKLVFKCIEEMDADYGIWLHGKVLDRGILSDKRKQYGFENWGIESETDAKNWKVGDVYEYERTITINPGQYYLEFGLWNPEKNPETGQAYRLYPKVEMGWTQIK